MELKVRIEHDPRFRGTAIYFYGTDKDGEFVVEPLTLSMKHYTVGERLNQPTLMLNSRDGEPFLQALSQALVQSGFKPDELKSKDLEVSAIKYHLEDMRSLALKGTK